MAIVYIFALILNSWSRTPATERSKLLLKIADAIEQRLDEFAEVESRDQGKPVSLAKAVDIPRAVHNFRIFATAILHHTEALVCFLFVSKLIFRN